MSWAVTTAKQASFLSVTGSQTASSQDDNVEVLNWHNGQYLLKLMKSPQLPPHLWPFSHVNYSPKYISELLIGQKYFLLECKHIPVKPTLFKWFFSDLCCIWSKHLWCLLFVTHSLCVGNHVSFSQQLEESFSVHKHDLVLEVKDLA